MRQHYSGRRGSRIRCFKLQGIDSFAYLRDVFSRIATRRANRIDELTPRGWAAALATKDVGPALPA